MSKDQLTETLQSLSTGRFLTIRELSIERADVYGALQLGFLYGSSPVVKVNLTLETVWLRSWTKEYMPDTVRASLGIELEKDESSSEDDDEEDFS
jgi:hypothetical protein